MSNVDNHALRGNSPTRADPSREVDRIPRSSSSSGSRTSSLQNSSSGRGSYSSRDSSRERERPYYSSNTKDSSSSIPSHKRERSDSGSNVERGLKSSTAPSVRTSQHPSSGSSSMDKHHRNRSGTERTSTGSRSSEFSFNEKEVKSVSTPRRTMWGSRSVDVFEKLEQIGEGTYGKVYMAKNRDTGEIVALKKVRMANEKEGFPITAIREIKILKELHHENIVQLKEIVTSKATKEKGKQGIYMVFEYMDHDLTGLMLNEGRNWRPSPAHIKCYMKQLLEGLHYCHSNNVLHRDIKGSNLLTNNKGELKLADFGLARPFTDQPGQYTNRVITLWYRPPELLLGSVQYGPAIDMWSAGCILTELLVGRAIFPGRNEIDQLELIFKLCGTPNDQNWPDVDKQPWWHMFKPQKEYRRALGETLLKMSSNISKEALDLIDRMLTLDPKKRITATDALDSNYFWTLPEPAKPSQMPSYPSSHEYQAKKKRQQPQQGSVDNTKRQKGPQGAPIPNQTQAAPPPPKYPHPTSVAPPIPPTQAPPPPPYPAQRDVRSSSYNKNFTGGYPPDSKIPTSGLPPSRQDNNNWKNQQPPNASRPSIPSNRPPRPP